MIVVAVCSVVFSAALLVPYTEKETDDPEQLFEADAEYMSQDIYVDGRLVFNWTLKDPVVSALDSCYIPLELLKTTEKKASGSAAVAVGSLVDGALVVSEEEKTAAEDPAAEEQAQEPSQDEDFSFAVPMLPQDTGYVDHKFERSFTATYGYKTLRGNMLRDTTDILVSEDGVFYGSEEFLEKSLGIDVYVTEGGVYLSTDPEVSAKRWADSNPNETYAKGIAEYIRVINRKIPAETAEYYSFLFRHVAGQYKNISPSLIFAVVWTESTFKADAGTNALGLMQALPKYAIARGYTEAMLLNPHTNLEYGAYYLSAQITSFRGSVVSGLAAYNMGPGALAGRSDHRTGYVNTVLGRMDQLKKWLASKGYGTEFVEQITLLPEGGEQAQEQNGI